MIRRSLIAVLCWLLLWEPSWAACTINGVGDAQTTISAAIPTRSVVIDTAATGDVLVLLTTVNSQGGTPLTSISSITGGGLSWSQRFIEASAVPDCYASHSTCYMAAEVQWAEVTAPLTSQSFSVSFTTAVQAAFLNMHIFGVSGLVTPSGPWDTDVTLPAKGTNYTGNSGTLTAKQVTGVSTTNNDDVLLYACFQNRVHDGTGASCDYVQATSGQPWPQATVTGYQQNVFGAFFDNSSIWARNISSAVTNYTVTAQDPAKTGVDWIAYADALVCTSGGPAPPTPNAPRPPFMHGWPW